MTFIASRLYGYCFCHRFAPDCKCRQSTMIPYRFFFGKHVRYVMYSHHKYRSCKICAGWSDHTFMKSSRVPAIFFLFQVGSFTLRIISRVFLSSSRQFRRIVCETRTSEFINKTWEIRDPQHLTETEICNCTSLLTQICSYICYQSNIQRK